MSFWYTLIGVAFSFTSEIWVGWGNIQVKYSHKIDAESDDPQPVYKRPRWWLGVFLYVLNMIFSLISYMFASIDVLAPTSAFTIIINAVLARMYFDEQLSVKGIIGSFLIMIGCVVSIVFGSHSQDEIEINQLLAKAENSHFITYSIFDISIIMMFIVISLRLKSHDTDDRIDSRYRSSGFFTCSSSFTHGIRAVLMCFSAAGVAGWVQIFGKICADLIFDTLTGNNQFDSILSWAIVIISGAFIFLELYMISEMMRIFDAVLAIPLFNSFQILSSIFLSEAYFDNFGEYTLSQGSIFIIGLTGIIIGIIFVTVGQNGVSMKNHDCDRMKYTATKHQIIKNGDELSSHFNNVSMADIPIKVLKKHDTVIIDNENGHISDSMHSLQVIDSDIDERATLL